MSSIAIIGGGPAGLFAAERLASAGLGVTVFDRMPSPGRKFLMAGRGGLNLTHSEPLERFLGRYPDLPDALERAIRAFPPDALRDFARDLGETTFIGTSGRVFPQAMKASPMLRAWLRRLESLRVAFRFRHDWRGWDETGALSFATPDGPVSIRADATLLALGGASWPRLGSDGRWTTILGGAGVEITPMLASNVGVLAAWTAKMRERAGEPLKRTDFAVGATGVIGEAVVTEKGLEGGAIYALSSAIRAGLAQGRVTLMLDFRPDLTHPALLRRLSEGRKGDSLANRLRKGAGLSAVQVALLHEAAFRDGKKLADEGPQGLARRIKACPVPITGMAGLERAISTAGGVRFGALSPDFMLQVRPGTFVAGEMLDWDAPTGGYLLQATFATGNAAAQGMLRWLAR
ncbi:MAG: aminoacetone oxidase family FAD-binding enzyme [Methylobacterium sp.]|nr:MAG: aminoacetone oxidase family FAD-binding enzyme [Methylobacterium sp.]